MQAVQESGLAHAGNLLKHLRCALPRKRWALKVHQAPVAPYETPLAISVRWSFVLVKDGEVDDNDKRNYENDV